MLKFVISDEKVYLKLLRLPLGRYFFMLNINKFPGISDPRAEESFLSQFILPNKTLKSTSSSRFKELDDLALKYFDPGKKYVVHDIAVSDGLASLELYNKLSADNSEFYISDKYSKFYIANGFITRIYSADYTLMHFYLFNFFYADNKISNWFFLSKLLFLLLRMISGRSVASPGQLSEIKLYNHEVIQALKSGEIRELDYDVLNTRTERKFTFIRAMNILNRVYFTEEEILRALNNMLYTLKDEGILLAGRTSKGVTHATFYKKTNSRLVILETINNGSDTDVLVRQPREIF